MPTVVSPARRTERVRGLAVHLLGAGSPVTLFVHGLGGSHAETRPLAADLPGTRVLMDLRGHGDSDPLTRGWDYDLLAEDLRSVADETGADRCVGVSVGAGALLRLLHQDPERFVRTAFVLPAAIDATRADGATEQLRGLGRAIESKDPDSVAAALLEQLPPAVRTMRGVDILLRRRAATLITQPPPRPQGDDRPLPDRAALRAMTAPSLVVSQDDDPLHPASLAAELAAGLPDARLLRLGPGGVFWTDAKRVRSALAEHLTGDLP